MRRFRALRRELGDNQQVDRDREQVLRDGRQRPRPERRVGVEPLRIVAGAPTLASDEDRAAILDTLNSRSLGVSFDSDGGAVTGSPVSVCG